MTASALPVFDGHNDVLLRLHGMPRSDPEQAFLQGRPDGHLDLPRMRAGGFAGGLFAIFIPGDGGLPAADADMQGPSYAIPLTPAPGLQEAQRAALRMASILFRIEDQSEGTLRVCRTASEIRASIDEGRIAAVLHVEGAEAIDSDLHMLDVLYAAGLRSLGPVWSRSNIFGHGVPFRFPSGADIGEGLTEAGHALVRACNRLRILIDLSHLNAKGFWDVARLSDAPLVATHSNVHALCASSRNLDDRQLAAIAESGGLVGVNFATAFLRADGRKAARTGLDEIIRHLDYLIGVLGEDGVALGSDFDGAVVPDEIGDAAGLQRLVAAMRGHGYGEALLAKLTLGNWLSILERTWGR